MDILDRKPVEVRKYKMFVRRSQWGGGGEAPHSSIPTTGLSELCLFTHCAFWGPVVGPVLRHSPPASGLRVQITSVRVYLFSTSWLLGVI